MRIGSKAVTYSPLKKPGELCRAFLFLGVENQFNKAIRLLDIGRVEQASAILREIIAEAQKENNSLFFIRASCVLGELLFSNREIDEAKNHLLNVIHTPYKNDVVDYEKSVASDILSQIE